MGTAFYIIYTILKSLSYVFVQELYNLNTYTDPDEAYKTLQPYQLLFARSAIAVTTVAVVLNVKLKKSVWDPVNRTNSGPLIFRTIQGTISNFINYSVAKYIPSSIISVISQITPIATVVLAFFILKEVIKVFDSILMGVNLVAIFLTILGSTETDSGLEEPPCPMWVIWTLVIVNPFGSAAGTIAMRKMAKFSEYTVSWYLNISLMLLSLAFCAITEGKYMFVPFAHFTWVSWMWMILAGTLTIAQ